MDTCNKIIEVMQKKLQEKQYDPQPDVEEKERKKPKKTLKQIFYY